MLGWQVWAVLSAMFAAATAILVKLGVKGIPSDYATFLRTVIVLIPAGLIAWLGGQVSNPVGLPRKALLFLALSGLATAGSWLCYFRALEAGPVSRVAPIDKLSVAMVAVLGVAFLGERLTWTHWLGVALMAGGAALVSMK